MAPTSASISNTADGELILQRFAAAVVEVTEAVTAAVMDGKKPQRSREPEIRWSDNGLPSLSDGMWGAGPFDYPSALDPGYGDEAAREKGRYPADRFPAVAALLDDAIKSHRIAALFGEDPAGFLPITLKLALERAVNAHIARSPPANTPALARRVLRPLAHGLLDDNLQLAIVAPIALVRFDFDRLRLGPNHLILRMSEALQKARWSAKAHAAKGHDSVLGAATHAFVLTGWSVGNAGFFDLARTLGSRWETSSEAIAPLFSALQLVTGVETGYAQELRLARGWRLLRSADEPEVTATAARRYPEGFDDYGWTRSDIPLVTRRQMIEVRTLLTTLLGQSHPRLGLALRRLTSAVIRHDPVDAILDAVIAMEVLLGDASGEAIAWKLRMRAAALAGLDGDPIAAERMHNDIAKLYKERSAIVHGAASGKSPRTDPHALRALAIGVLRQTILTVLRRPDYLDPLRIDAELMLGQASRSDAAPPA